MVHASLFSGEGGFDLAAQWMSWENALHCESNPFCQRILKYYWPDAELYSDIKTADLNKWAEKIDILSGGFPCQPYSFAGERKGTADERHLWPFMLDAIRTIKPRWVVGENVRGLVSWSGGLVFEQICLDLESAGYSVQPFLLPACGINAPHRRERIFFVAYASSAGLAQHKRSQQALVEFAGFCQGNVEAGTTTNASSSRGAQVGSIAGERPNGQGVDTATELDNWAKFPTQSPLCGGNDGLSARLDNITFPSWRSESIKAHGNAVVPGLVYKIFQAIEAYEL